MEPIRELLRARGIALIEDCAQAHWADYRGKKVGTYGDFGCFSLQQSKQMTCGDGGITLVNRDDLADRAALFVDKGWNRRSGLRTHLFLGMNYRMTELQAAVARAQLRKLPALIARRQATASMLSDRLRGIRAVSSSARDQRRDPPGVVDVFVQSRFSRVGHRRGRVLPGARRRRRPHQPRVRAEGSIQLRRPQGSEHVRNEPLSLLGNELHATRHQRLYGVPRVPEEPPVYELESSRLPRSM
jgi:hypothetical protein